MLEVVLLYLYALAIFLLILGAGSLFERDPHPSFSLARGVLLAGSLGFLSFFLPKAYPLFFGSFLLLALLGIQRTSILKVLPLTPYLSFFTYLFLLQTLPPFYYGAGWYGDWFEHYQRTLFFLGKLPFDTRFLGLYGLLARTPLFHLTEALFLRPAPTFYFYQILSTLLNSLFFFPFLALLEKMGKRHFLFLLFLSPYALRMATFPFPKALTAFFVLTALLHFTASEKLSSKPLTEVGLFFGAAILTHQSALFYLIPTLFWLFLKKGRWLSTLSFSLLPLLPWLALAVFFYSPQALFTQTPASSYLPASSSLQWLHIKLLNLLGAFFPTAFLRILTFFFHHPSMPEPLLTFLEAWQNFAFGALPSLFTLTFFFFALFSRNPPAEPRESSARLPLPRSLLHLLLPTAFLADILSASNAGVSSGVAQNGMMPLALLLALLLVERVQNFPKPLLLLSKLECLAAFLLPTALFLLPPLYSHLLPYFANNAHLYFSFHLQSLFDLTPSPARILFFGLALTWLWRAS